MRTLLAVAVLLTACTHPGALPEPRKADCKEWQAHADYYELHGPLALNVDDKKARQWLEQEAARGGCRISWKSHG